MAFPKLTEEQITQLARYAGASTKTFRAGEALFRAGDRDPKFFVIKSGELEIIDVTGDQPKTIRVQGPGDFTGDVGHLTGSPKVVSAIARSDCEVYEMSEAELRKVLNQDPQLSDIILQAFIARRQLMRESPEFTGLRVIGSRYSRDTFRIRDFLAKNRVLFTWLDLEGDPAVKESAPAIRSDRSRHAHRCLCALSGLAQSIESRVGRKDRYSSSSRAHRL